jgi:predicted MFS family arabinose efflux permease
VVLLLSGVLALEAADTAMIGGLGPLLERQLGISHTQLGLFSTVSAGVGALTTPIAGILADRRNRVRLLVLVICGWGVALIAAGLFGGYLPLLLSRLALGAAVAAAGPVTASLIGDLFLPRERGRVYGWVLSGETLGAGVGLLLGGGLGVAISWRAPFFVLAAASLAMAVVLHRSLQEPSRGGADRLRVDQTSGGHDDTDHQGRAAETADRQGVPPADERVLPASHHMSYRQAAIYTLRVPTVRSIIIASTIGYFFFAGLRAFAVLLAVRYYDLAAAMITVVAVTVGAAGLAGTVLGGRLVDRLLARGRLTARVDLPPWEFIGSAFILLPALLLTNVWAALPLVMAGTALLAATNPPLDAARLDIIPAHLWGRAESVRTAIRLVAESASPVLFGLTADRLSPGPQSGTGVRNAFLVMLLPLAVNGVLLLRARRTYPADVATAAASQTEQQ